MTKGLSSSFIGLYGGILEDAIAYHPSLRGDCMRDLSRLKTLSSAMGAKVFTLMLPALGKVLDYAQESGALDFSTLPLARRYKRGTQIPRLFRGFWLAIADDDGCLKQDIDPTILFFLRTLLFAGKKYWTDCAPAALYETVKEYYDVDSSLPSPSPCWDGDGSTADSVSTSSLEDVLPPNGGLFRNENSSELRRLLRVAQECADRVSSALGEYIPSVSRFRHGPGAVSDLRYKKDFKYSFPYWSPRLQHVFPASIFGLSRPNLEVENWSFDEGGITSQEGVSHLIDVPKTMKAPRLIAAEPTCHQWCQQSVRSALTVAISESYISLSIDFSNQKLSQDAALRASITGDSATVDLSSASDRLSCYVVERLFRRNTSYLSAFIACRTRFISNDIDVKQPRLHKLRKFASMGSALTFPVQSLSFYILCLAAGVLATGSSVSAIKLLSQQVRVYGDDLIVPVSWMPFVEELFRALFLKINSSKTFTKGNFRESCGADCYRGYDVTPGQVRQFYDESKPSTLEATVQCANNLFLKGLWRASHYVLSQVPKHVLKYVPCVPVGSGSFGFLSMSGARDTAVTRWNRDLHRWEYLAFSFGSRAKSTSKNEGSSNLLQYFTEDPSGSQLSTWESGVVVDPTPVIRRGWVPSEMMVVY